jgi:hypothetical protein
MCFNRLLSIIRKTSAIDGSQTYIKPLTLPVLLTALGVILICIFAMTTINYIRIKFVKSSDQIFDLKMSSMVGIHGLFCQGNIFFEYINGFVNGH